VWGSLDEADVALGRLRERSAYPGPVARLSAASRQLRRSGILRELQTLTPRKSLNKPYEILIRRREGAGQVIIVFTGFALRFWLSLNALDQFLRRFDAHVIYLSDHSGTMYLNGLGSIGPGYDNLLRMLRKQLDILGPREILVLASSAGGFVGLRAAVDLQAQCFAGMSIRTTLSPSSRILMSPFEEQAVGACRYPEMLIDLRPFIQATTYPLCIQLYCGDRSELDAAHARNLAGIPRVEVNYLKDYEAHDAISGLIARGEFEQVLHRFVRGGAGANLVQADRA
jgi:pimeloyl-ACP methyl ester carboxylesterase